MVALVAALAALAVAGRLVFAPIPNVMATTDIVLITGYALGAGARLRGRRARRRSSPTSGSARDRGRRGRWRAGGWSALGGAWLAALTRPPARPARPRDRLRRSPGFAYGALLDLSVMVTYGGEQSLDRYLALSARGLPFNVAHAVGNVALALAAGPALVRMLSRFRDRFEFTWRPAGGAAAGARRAGRGRRSPGAPAATDAAAIGAAWLARRAERRRRLRRHAGPAARARR